MHPISQIIDRNLHRNGARGSALWINPEKDDCWQKTRETCSSLKLLSQEHGAYRFLQQSGAEAGFGAFPQTNNEKYQWIILNLPRQKALLKMMLAYAASLLADDGVLWLAGENRAGIKSAGKLLKIHFNRVGKLDNARHCTLFEASKPFDNEAFNPRAFREEWLLECNSTSINVASYPGVFAHGRLDAGTALLLTALAGIPAEGEVLDFACGAGVIGACIAAGNEHANVTLLDSNALALRSCEETLAGNRLKGSVLASDGLCELKGRFDMIVSNPPIHAGVKTDSQLSIKLMEGVHDFINPDGLLIMVANIHLPYERWLSTRFRHCKQLACNDHYKVIMAKK